MSDLNAAADAIIRGLPQAQPLPVPQAQVAPQPVSAVVAPTPAPDSSAESPLQVRIPTPAPTQAQTTIDTPPPPPIRFKTNPGVDTSNMNTNFVSRLNRLYELMPENLRNEATMTSGVRSRETQQRLHLEYEMGIGGRAAAAGHSQHDPAVRAAVDLSGHGASVAWLWSKEGKEALASVGLTAPFGDDRGHIQMSEAGARSSAVTDRRVADNKGQSPDELFESLLKGSTGPGLALPSRTPSAAELVEQSGATGFEAAATLYGEAMAGNPETNAAIFNGIRKGMMDLPLGVAQATLPRAAMEPIEAQVRDLNARFQDLEDKHPNFDYAGRLMGSTAAIASSSGLLGATRIGALVPRAVTTVWNAIGTLGRGAAIGAAAGGTQFYPEGPEREDRPLGLNARAFDTAVGSIWGAAVGSIARGVQWAAKNISDTTYASQFMSVLKETAAGVTRNSERPLNETVSQYQRLEKQAATKYNLRNAMGRQFEGFPSGVGADKSGEEGFVQAIDGVLAESRKSGVETRRRVETTARRVENILGLDAEKGRAAEAAAQEKIHAEAIAKADQAEAAHPLAAAFKTNPTLPDQLRAAGQLPPRPEAPPPYEPRPVTAERYAQARTAVNATLRSTRDTAARNQLKMLLGGIDEVAADTAGEHGMGAQEFLRRANAANDFYMKNVAPLRQFFGGKTSKEVVGRQGVPMDGVTPAQFYDKVTQIIESDDTAAIRDLAKVLGPRGRDNMKMIAASRAIDDAASVLTTKDEKTAFRYVRDHGNGLRELLGRDEYDQLAGMAKIADRIAGKFKVEAGKTVFDWSHSFGPALAFYSLFEGRFAKAAEITLALPAYHLATNILYKIHATPVLRPLVRRAATMRPGSVELDALIGEIERRSRAIAYVGARATSP